MARIRTIKPEFWKNEDLCALPEGVHFLAAALLNQADDEGYFNANPGLIKSEAYPLREPSISIQESLARLASVGYLRLGITEDGKRFGHIRKFSEHQRVNRPVASKIKGMRISWDSSLIAHPQLTEDSVSAHGGLTEDSPQEGKGKEGNREGKGITTPNGVVVADSSAPPPLALDGEAKIKPPKPPTPDCPHEEIIAAYHEILPEWVQVGVWNGERQKKLRARWREDRDRQRIDYWRELFGYVRKSDFLMGRVPPKGDRSPFSGDLEFLVTPRYFNRLIEGRYHNG